MRKTLIIAFALFILLPLTSAYLYEQESYSSPSTFTDKWDYREDNKGSHTGFTLTHTYTAPRYNYYYENSPPLIAEIRGDNYYLNRHRFNPSTRTSFSQPTIRSSDSILRQLIENRNRPTQTQYSNYRYSEFY